MDCNERLKLAKEALDSGSYDRETIEYIFPELVESDDEKIRKDLIEWIKEFPDSIWRGHYTKDVIAWLEKQGEQKSIDDLTQQEAMDIAVAKCFEQGEHKTTNKVEPKFKVGDWIVGSNSVYKVISLNNELSCYIVISVNDEEIKIPYYFDCGPNHMCSYHLWTIQDAKDGDVLSNGNMILIFKEFEIPAYKQYIIAYIGLDICGHIQVTDGYWTLGIDKTKPATKEQRDLLFQKMKEAGYEWDAEKKELRKIEQKSKWSKEDEDYLNDLERYFTNLEPLEHKAVEAAIWLESLKQRMEEQQ